MNLIIGFSGKMRAGKTTAANMAKNFLTSLGFKAEIKSFATALRKEVMEKYRLTEQDVTKFKDQKVPSTLIRPEDTPRHLLQKHGHLRRNGDSDYWIKKLAENMNSVLSANTVYLIDDVRFPNEMNFITKNSGHLIRINRPLEFRGILSEDESEKALDSLETSMSASIENDSKDLNDLNSMITLTLKKLLSL